MAGRAQLGSRARYERLQQPHPSQRQGWLQPQLGVQPQLRVAAALQAQAAELQFVQAHSRAVLFSVLVPIISSRFLEQSAHLG